MDRKQQQQQTNASGDDEVRDQASAVPPASPQASAATPAALQDDAKPVFRTLGLDDAPDQLHYRSMAKTISAAGPPSLGLMRGGPAGLGLGGLPGAPLAFAPGKSKPAAFSAGLKKPEAASAAPSVGVRVDKTKYVGASPRELPPPPFRLELHTHFHAKLEAIQRVCSVVGRKLCELDTDFAFKGDKCKWKVEYRRGAGVQRVELNILVFKTPKEYVVELQRRAGDITALMHLFGELKAAFKRNQLLVEKSGSSAGGAGLKRPAPSAAPKTPALSRAAVRDGVGAVRGLLASRFADAQLQGVLGAISLSAQLGDGARTELAPLVAPLVAIAQAPRAPAARLVGVALSRLCDEPECRQAFVASPGWQFIVECAAGGDGVAPEVQRESLRVVEALCALYHDELAKAPGAAKVLALVQDWQSIEDPRLKQHACNAHRALQDAGVIA